MNFKNDILKLSGIIIETEDYTGEHSDNQEELKKFNNKGPKIEGEHEDGYHSSAKKNVPIKSNLINDLKIYAKAYKLANKYDYVPDIKDEIQPIEFKKNKNLWNEIKDFSNMDNDGIIQSLMDFINKL